ncbi:Hsp70 family protein [Clostridium sp. DMHC 10]|uniref:Hsp70 family protein n=1 Tax=Clostridium sp. DMHC 10 TaxID=747377 RepID=UPI00241D50C3|nr:Hsp70 family protein [Clostridium sp. DMHC 10]
MKYSLGIDLGTTFSVVSVIDKEGIPKVLNNSEGKTLTPSVIYFGEENIFGRRRGQRNAGNGR